MDQVSVNALKIIAKSLAEHKNSTIETVVINSPLPRLDKMLNSEWIEWNQMAEWLAWYDTSPWAPVDWSHVGELCFRAQNIKIAAAVCRLSLVSEVSILDQCKMVW